MFCGLTMAIEDVSIHASVKDATLSTSATAGSEVFQSTRP